MGVSNILGSIDREIALLKQVRALLSGSAVPSPKKKVSGRKQSVAVAVSAVQTAAEAAPKKRRKKRKLSPEGRKRIADAVKSRWEAQRKAAASK
jgi:hypothetical protein